MALASSCEEEGAFRSSSADLDRVWELCRYSIEALRFDLYQDTPTRERWPYEGDALINQLSEYNVQRSYALARYSTACPIAGVLGQKQDQQRFTELAERLRHALNEPVSS